MHFTSSVHNTAFVKVLGYVELCSASGDTNFQKRSYADLCKVAINSQTCYFSCASFLCHVWENCLVWTINVLWFYCIFKNWFNMF